MSTVIQAVSGRFASIVTITKNPNRDLIDFSLAKAVLGITTNDGDIALAFAITMASAAIEQFCNRNIVVDSFVEEFWPPREPLSYQLPGGIAPLQLLGWPVVAVTSVSVQSTALVDGADYRLDARNGEVLRLDGLGYPASWAPFPISVSYTAGFAEIPSDIQDATIRLVNAARFRNGRDPLLKSEQIDGIRRADYWVSAGSDGNMTPDVADILENYRVPVVA